MTSDRQMLIQAAGSSAEEADFAPPRWDPACASVTCQRCGEKVIGTEKRVRRIGRQELCRRCFEAASAST